MHDVAHDGFSPLHCLVLGSHNLDTAATACPTKSSTSPCARAMAAPRTRTGSGGSSNDFNFRAAGSKTEAAIKEMEHGVHKFFTGMEESLSKITRPSWLGGGSGPSKQAPAPPVVHSKQEHPTPTPSGEDDSTMRHHCAALERLVEMGLSPQAAKVAVRHLDSWLVSEDGRSEMAVAEAEATSTGEAILHVHDQVRLEGLVKNKGTNGMMGTLEAYGAESHRWKVRLTDDQVFWIKPKLLRPLKMQRMPLPLPDPSPPEHTTGEDEQVCSTSLAHAWAKFEAKQRAWKEEQEDREIRLLEKEEVDSFFCEASHRDSVLVLRSLFTFTVWVPLMFYILVVTMLAVGRGSTWQQDARSHFARHDGKAAKAPSMRSRKSRSPPRSKLGKSSSLPNIKKAYVAPLQLCSVDLHAKTFSIKDIKKGAVASRGSQRLPFMAFERGVEWERPGAKATAPPPKLPSLSRIMHSIQSMNFSDQSLSVMTSGSLRSNPAFGGSGHCRGGPKLPVKHSKKRLESLLHKAPRKTSPTRPSSKSKNRKRAAWGGGLETHEFRVDTVDLEEPLAVVEAQAPEPKKEEKLEKREEESDSSSDSSSLTSDSSSDSSSDLADSSDDEEALRLSLNKRSSGLTRRMSAFAMMLPLLDSNNQPVRRSSVAEAFLKKVEDNGDDGDNDAELDFPWSDEECRSVFIKFDTDTDGEVATEELQMMLRYMGCILRPGEIERLVKDMFSYATEWMTFLERYREVDEQYLRAEFAAADADGNGVLDVQELRALLNKMGYVTEAHTVQEAMDTIGCGVSGCVNLRKFEKLREHLRCTEGLAKDDVQELRTLYDRMARTAKAESRSRKVDIGAGSQSDIAKKLIAETQEMPVEDVSRLVDNDESGYISFQERQQVGAELLLVRDAEREAIASVFDLLTEDGSPLLMQDLPRALVELKYFATDDLIFSILDDLYPLENQKHMSRDQIASFLREFRDREGLTHLETADIRQAFDHQCKVTSQRKFVQQLEDPAVTSPKNLGDMTPAPAKPESATKLRPAAAKASALSPVPSPKANGSPRPGSAPIVRALDSLQASRVMRWFNFAKPMQEVQQLLEQFDLDGIGKLEFEGFLKLMRGFFLEEREKQWNVFAMLDSRGNGHVPVSKLPKLYDDTSVGMTKRGEQAARMAGFSLLDTKNAVSRSAFELFCRNFRHFSARSGGKELACRYVLT
eukprot:s2298_g8.t2